MPIFTSNVPRHELYQRAVLPTPERIEAAVHDLLKA